MQVQQIILKQVGPFGDATIALPPGERPDLADVYLLTGPNGSGKSTALYAVAGVIGSGQNDLGRLFQPNHVKKRQGVNNRHRVEAAF